MHLHLLKKEGVIFAAGVFCGFFIRTILAKRNHDSENNYFNDDGVIASENSIEMMRRHIEEGEKHPTVGDNEIIPECFMKVPEIIKYAGYPVEEHIALTKDGYKLGLHRIPHGMNDTDVNDNSRPVVFLQHGLLADSANWVSNGAEKSLAFLLADFGCDVWLGNVRGNTYSRQHVTLNPDVDEKFWRYSWQQFSEIDLPTMVDFVLNFTGREKLYYIGHSQGTLIMFARLAEDSKFNEKISLFFALGPVFNLQHIKSPIKHLTAFHNTLMMGHSVLGGAELLPNSEAGKKFATQLHSWVEQNPNAKYHGTNLMLNIAGFNPERYCQDRLPVYLAHTPAGTSIQNIIHFAQMIALNKTCKYSRESKEENVKEYGSSEPPSYNLSAIRTPVALFWGSEDWFADTDDVLSIIPELKTLVLTKEMKNWDHLEFLFGAEAAFTLYKEIANMIREKEQSLKTAKFHEDL